MEGKHIVSHPHHHEHQESKGTETGHNNDPNDTRVCRRCGWTYPNAHPSAKHRKKHKKHCGKIEGFKLINPTTKELKYGSSDDDLTEDEHMSTVNKKTEGERITDHQHQHEHLSQPAGSKTNNTKDHRDVYHCHCCGWPYPNHYPGPKHRRNHRKHCGKIEGYPSITSEDRETQGGSSDDEHKSKEHVEMEGKHISSYQHEHEQKLPESADSSSRKLENNLNDLDVSSSEANVEKAGQKMDTSDNTNLNSCQIIVPDAKVSHLKSFNESPKELSEAATGTTIELGLHGLIASGTTELPKDSTHQDAKGPVEHVEFTDKGHNDHAELKIQKKKDDRVLSMLGESSSSDVQPHPSFDDLSGVCDLQIMNEAVKDDTRVSKSEPHIPKDVKISFSEVQDPGKIEVAKSTTTTHAPIHHKGIGSRKIGIASILSFKDLNSSSVEEGSASAGKKIYEVAQINHQADGEKQDVSISEMKGQEMQHDMLSTSDCGEGLSTIISSGADSQKENPQSWALEPQSEKVPQSLDISIDPSATNLDYEGTGAVACHQEAKSTVTQAISDKPEVYAESKNSYPLNADSGSCRGREEPQIFSNVNSYKVLSQETDQTLIVSGLVNQDTLKETEVPCSKGIEKISDGENDLQASSKVVITVQAMSVADGCLPESSKEAKQKEVESSACVVLGVIDHENNGFDPDYRKEDSTEQKSTHSGIDIFKHEVESSACKVLSIIDPDKNSFDLDCKKEDTTEQTSTISDMDIFKHGDPSEIAQQKLNKTHASEIAVDEKPAAPEFHLSECVDYSHEGNTVEQDISVKLEDHVESTSISHLICGDTDKSRVGEKPASFQHKIYDGMLLLDEGKEKVIRDALMEQKPVESDCFKAIEISCENQDAQDSIMVIADPGVGCTDHPQTGNSNAGESEEVQCRASSSNIIEHGMNNGSSDCKIQDSTQGNITLSESDVHDDTKIIPLETVPKISINEAVNENSAASESHQQAAMVHTVEEKSTEEQITKIIPVETVPEININEAINENSAASESHQQETIVHTDEEKGTEKEAISVKLRDNIESKLISPSNGVIESHRDESSLNSNVGMAEYVFQPEVHKSLTTGSDLSKNALLDEAEVPDSKGIERDIVQKVDFQTSSELIITDHRTSVTASSPVKDSQLGQIQSAACSGFAKMTTNECNLRDGNPGCNSNISVQDNTALREIGMDGDIYSNIRPQEKFPKAPVNDLDQEPPSLESIKPKKGDTNSSLQDYDHKDLKAEIHREESDWEGNEMGRSEHTVLKHITQLQADKVFVNKSCSATKESSYLNDGTDNLENSCRESIDDVHEDKIEPLKNCEPALWEQLLETNVNKSTNQETSQDLGNAGTSPGNPFIYGHKLSSKEDISQTLAINGRHGLMSERGNMSAEAESTPYTNNSLEQDPIVNNGNEGGGDMKAIHSKEKISETSLMTSADLFEAPSFMTLVESGNHSERQLSCNELQPKVKESNGELNADAEMASGTHERFHTPLRSLLAEENIRGTQEHSKPDPLHVFQPQTSSENKFPLVQASTVEVSNQTSTSSQKQTLQLKDINSPSKNIAEKIWNSPARLPTVKIEKQKVSKVRSAWSMCLCGCDTK